jgi:hypothetical protein
VEERARIFQTYRRYLSCARSAQGALSAAGLALLFLPNLAATAAAGREDWRAALFVIARPRNFS